MYSRCTAKVGRLFFAFLTGYPFTDEWTIESNMTKSSGLHILYTFTNSDMRIVLLLSKREEIEATWNPSASIISSPWPPKARLDRGSVSRQGSPLRARWIYTGFAVSAPHTKVLAAVRTMKLSPR